ncbi:TIGR00730 family Rossman fold protein [uncultured Desulfobacter sp.]|uniref:LOG family protein n=1 Tax=uncultured Desulfobacter sp. TaxID=240139 RepID=UPI002AA65984|nr:TIGR00730 family Rossman fold protein [uncultured Desulfobacter sp.]
MKRICINCGSNSGARSEYMETAIKLGQLISNKGIELVYGGAEVGLMGAVASAAMKNGGKVIGVIPESFADKVADNNLSELHIVPTMHERKKMMFDLSDGFIALPGGMGTIEEVFEILTWAQLGLHQKPCGIINICGYFDKLLEFLDYSVDQLFIKRQHREMVLVSNEPGGLLGQFEKYKAPVLEKWIDRK